MGGTESREGVCGQRGQAAVELALVLPVLLLVVFGIVEFGRGLSAYLTIQNAAREGARLAVTGASNADIEDLVRQRAQYLEGAGDPGVLTVEIAPAEASERRPGTSVTVAVTYKFRLIVPLISNITGEQIDLLAQMSMRI